MGFMDKLNDLAKKAQDKIQEVASKVTTPEVAAAPAPVQDWYYTIDGKTKHGPFTLDQLKKLAKAGQLQPAHMVRQEGTTKWIAAEQVEALRTSLVPLAQKQESVADPVPKVGPPPLPMNPDEMWYYAKGEQQIGPVSLSDLKVLAQSGQLTQQDLVWKAGMNGWEPARQVQGLFDHTPTATTPPPLPPPRKSARSPSEEVLEVLPVEQGKKQAISQAGSSDTAPHWGQRFSSFLQKTIRPDWVQYEQRKQLLHGSPSPLFGGGNKKWEPVGHDGPALLFFADGGFMRSDGFGAKFVFDPATDIITLTVPGFDTAITIKLLSVTKDELVLAVEDRAMHYQQVRSISGERRAASQEKQKEFIKQAAILTGKALAATAAAAALAVLVLGVAAVGVAGAAGGGQGTEVGSGPTKTCSKCGMNVPYAATQCPYCGNDKTTFGSPWRRDSFDA